MFRRGISVLIVLCLLAVSVICLPAAASGETKVTLNKKVKYNAGKATISWKVEGEEENYIVSIQAVDNGTSPQGRFRLNDVKKNSVETLDMIPGKKYEVIIRGQFFNILDTRTYTVPEAEEFVDGKLKASSVKISMDPVKMKAGGNPKKDTKKIKVLKAVEIIEGYKSGKTDYGLKYTMKMPQLAKTRKYFVTIAFESPDGFLYVDRAGEVTFDRVNNGYQTVWLYITGNNFFYYLYKCIEDIPKGTYKVHLFWNGMKVQTQKFKVT